MRILYLGTAAFVSGFLIGRIHLWPPAAPVSVQVERGDNAQISKDLPDGPVQIVGPEKRSLGTAPATVSSQDSLADLLGLLDELLSENPPTPGDDARIAEAYRRWGRADPEAALADIAARKLPSRIASRLQEQVVHGWVLVDPQAAWLWAWENPGPPPQRYFDLSRQQSVIQDLVDYGHLQEAWKIVDSVEHDATKADLYRIILRRLSIYGIAPDREVAPFLAGSPRTVAVSAMASAMTNSDAQAGLDFLATLAVPQERISAARAVFSTLAANAPDLGAMALTTLPSGPERDTALAAFIVRTAGANPEVARQLVTLFNNENTRDTAVMSAARQLAARDPEGALRWITESVGSPARIVVMREIVDNVHVSKGIDRRALIISLPNLKPDELQQLESVVAGTE